MLFLSLLMVSLMLMVSLTVRNVCTQEFAAFGLGSFTLFGFVFALVFESSRWVQAKAMTKTSKCLA